MEYFEANDLGLIYLIYKNNIKNAKTYLSVSGCYEYLLISCKATKILELGEYYSQIIWFTEIITNPLSYVIRRCVKIWQSTQPTCAQNHWIIPTVDSFVAVEIHRFIWNTWEFKNVVWLTSVIG